MIEDVDLLATMPRNASAEPPEVIPPLDLMIDDQPVKKKGKYIMKRCREEAALQASDWKVVPDTVVHPPKPDILRSPVYEHFEFQQLKADPNVFQAACKLCSARIKIDTAWGYNKHFHSKKDYAHEIICKYMDVVKAKATYPGIRSALLVHKNTKEALVEWLIDTFVAPHCILTIKTRLLFVYICVYTYIYIYTTRTKVFDHHENFHTNSIKLDLLKKEHILKLEKFLHFF